MESSGVMSVVVAGRHGAIDHVDMPEGSGDGKDEQNG